MGDERISLIRDHQGASFWSGIFNIVNTIIGGGALSLPFVMKESGVALGVLFVFVIAILCFYSQRLIVLSSQFAYNRPATFGELGLKAFGTAGKYYTEGCIILFLIGAQISYLVIIGELLTPVLIKWGLENPDPKIVSLITAAAIVLPISCLPRMDSLKFTSFVALFFIFCLAVSVLVVSSRQLHDKGIIGSFQWIGTFQGAFRSLPILNFAFTFHPSIPPVWKELADTSNTNINRICLVSILICATFYLTLGLFGYLFYYQDTPANILQGFEDDWLFIIIRFGYSIVIIFSYPVLNYATRAGIDSLIFKTEAPWWRLVIESFLIITIAYLVSIFVPSVDIIFGFTGATVGQLVIFINPALFYIFLYDSSDYEEYNEKGVSTVHQSDSRRELNWRFFITRSKIFALILVVAGVVCGVVSVIEIVSGLVD